MPHRKARNADSKRAQGGPLEIETSNALNEQLHDAINDDGKKALSSTKVHAENRMIHSGRARDDSKRVAPSPRSAITVVQPQSAGGYLPLEGSRLVAIEVIITA